jgi:DNA-binding XRE family transcriptional regulator
LEEVLTKANKSKKFQVEYNKELSRLNLAKQIRDARIERKLTQKAVADKIGIP